MPKAAAIATNVGIQVYGNHRVSVSGYVTYSNKNNNKAKIDICRFHQLMNAADGETPSCSLQLRHRNAAYQYDFSIEKKERRTCSVSVRMQ